MQVWDESSIWGGGEALELVCIFHYCSLIHFFFFLGGGASSSESLKLVFIFNFCNPTPEAKLGPLPVSSPSLPEDSTGCGSGLPEPISIASDQITQSDSHAGKNIFQ